MSRCIAAVLAILAVLGWIGWELYSAGLTAMTLRAFLLATAIGMIPMTVLYVGVGATLTVDLRWVAVGGGIAVIVVLAMPWLVERFNPLGILRLLPHGRDRR